MMGFLFCVLILSIAAVASIGTCAFPQDSMWQYLLPALGAAVIFLVTLAALAIPASWAEVISNFFVGGLIGLLMVLCYNDYSKLRDMEDGKK